MRATVVIVLCLHVQTLHAMHWRIDNCHGCKPERPVDEEQLQCVQRGPVACAGAVNNQDC